MPYGPPPSAIPYARERPYDNEGYTSRLSDLMLRRGDQLAAEIRRGGEISSSRWTNAGNQIMTSLAQLAQGRDQERERERREQLEQEARDQQVLDNEYRQSQAADASEERKADVEWRREQFRDTQADRMTDRMPLGAEIPTDSPVWRQIGGTSSEAAFEPRSAMDARLEARPIADVSGVPSFSEAPSSPVESAPMPMPQPEWEPMERRSMSPDVAARPDRMRRVPSPSEAIAQETRALARENAEATRDATRENREWQRARAVDTATATAANRSVMQAQGAQRIAAANARLKIAQDEAASGGTLTRRQTAAMFQLATQVKSHPEYMDMLDINTGWQGVQVGLRQKNGFGDITAINAFQRMVDPGATVRSEDVVLLQTAAGLIDRILSDYPIDKLRTGDKLPDKVRDRMRVVAKELYERRAGNYNSGTGAQFRRQADAAGVPFDLVGMDFAVGKPVVTLEDIEKLRKPQ
ncbi:MAG: hypothetical protein O3C10_12670 [Chloroflexi bacterium]|nr:hypothetical protein [Chloroflexota bacterium]